MAVEQTRFCPHCEQRKSIKNFYKKPYTVGYLPVCRNCTSAVSTKAFSKYHSIGASVWASAMVQNIPMMKQAWDETEKKKAEVETGNGWFSDYYDALAELRIVYEGCYDSDMTIADFVEVREPEQVRLDYNQMSELWGDFYTKDGEFDTRAYDFLDALYHKYTDEIYTMDTAMELTYRDLCIAHWQKRQADMRNDIAEAEKAKKMINTALQSLKLDQFQNQHQTEAEKHIEYMAMMIENTKPAECEDLMKYKDFSGFEKPLNDIWRALRNLIAGTRDYPDIEKEDG